VNKQVLSQTTETHEILKTVYRNEALYHPCVFKCCARLKEERIKLESDPEGGQLFAAQNTVTIAKLCEPEIKVCHQITPRLTGRKDIRFCIRLGEK
jgi:hypothetical protein